MITVSNTALTNTFDFWRTKTNEMAHYFTTCVVTTTANSGTTAATGNAGITGTFTANGFVGNTANITSITVNSISIGNSSVNTSVISVGNGTVNAVVNSSSFKIANGSSNVTITNPTSAQISSGQYFLNANSTWSTVSSLYVINGSANTNGTTAQLVDSFDQTVFTTADYVVRVKDRNANSFYATKLLVQAVGTDSYVLDYGGIQSNTYLGAFSVTADASLVRLFFTPNTNINNTTVSFTRMMT